MRSSRMIRRKKLLLMAMALTTYSRASALEYVPVYRGSILGGQYFLGGTKASLSGNASLVAAPVLKFNDRWALLPMLSSNYRGTKGINDGVASGTLFQQGMDHRVSATGIYSPDGTTWRLKPSVSYKREFLKETLNETWGQGLFDYEKVGAGFEAENVYHDPFSYRLGVDFYRIRFPNYQSLEAAVGNDPAGNPLGRELSSKNVLDTYNFSVSMSGARPFPYDEPVVALQGTFTSLYQEYADQRLVDTQGQFTNHRPYGRRDFLQSVAVGVSHPRHLQMMGADFKLDSSFGANTSYNTSNQNTYDASFTKFVFDSYSYYNYGFGPALALSWGEAKRPSSASFSFSYSKTQYIGRLAQNSSGVYLTDTQWQERYVASLVYAYPIATGFYLKGQTSFLWAGSNQSYEKTYLYNYRTANYMMGFTYEY